MELIYRLASVSDLHTFPDLAAKSWKKFEHDLTEEHWRKLFNSITDKTLYEKLLYTATCIVCTTAQNTIIGMAFLVPSGNPTEIYDKDWSYIRMVSVDPDYAGNGIGKQLTLACIQAAKENGEKTIALHTSEIMVQARHIYESTGFTILKEIDKRLDKRYWLYTLSISNQA
ncbi:MAG: GNAT family N-acetyltransferase [Agriterribacter sp.]